MAASDSTSNTSDSIPSEEYWRDQFKNELTFKKCQLKCKFTPCKKAKCGFAHAEDKIPCLQHYVHGKCTKEECYFEHDPEFAGWFENFPGKELCLSRAVTSVTKGKQFVCYFKANCDLCHGEKIVSADEKPTLKVEKYQRRPVGEGSREANFASVVGNSAVIPQQKPPIRQLKPPIQPKSAAISSSDEDLLIALLRKKMNL